MGDTGRCALENDPETCPNRLAIASAREAIAGLAASDDIGSAVLSTPEENPSFPLSTTLGSAEIDAMMARRYVNVVGILGDPESGKTACLASLYLLVSNDALKDWSFADSRSLMGFESIARGARDWNHGMPREQMTVHTEMTDDRRPGFLHLRLRNRIDGKQVDFALPDLPGEWTKALVRTAQVDRFEFLRSAEVLWLMVDGKALLDREQTQGCITRLGQLVGRLVEMMGTSGLPRLLVVITHRDAGAPPGSVLARVRGELGKHGATAEILSVASFAEAGGKGKANTKPGEGIEALINATVSKSGQCKAFWPSSDPPEGSNPYLSYKGSSNG